MSSSSLNDVVVFRPAPQSCLGALAGAALGDLRTAVPSFSPPAGPQDRPAARWGSSRARLMSGPVACAAGAGVDHGRGDAADGRARLPARSRSFSSTDASTGISTSASLSFLRIWDSSNDRSSAYVACASSHRPASYADCCESRGARVRGGKWAWEEIWAPQLSIFKTGATGGRARAAGQKAARAHRLGRELGQPRDLRPLLLRRHDRRAGIHSPLAPSVVNDRVDL